MLNVPLNIQTVCVFCIWSYCNEQYLGEEVGMEQVSVGILVAVEVDNGRPLGK